MQKRKLLTADQDLTEKLREVLLAVFESPTPTACALSA